MPQKWPRFIVSKFQIKNYYFEHWVQFIPKISFLLVFGATTLSLCSILIPKLLEIFYESTDMYNIHIAIFCGKYCPIIGDILANSELGFLISE